MKDLKKDGIILGIITAVVLFLILKDDYINGSINYNFPSLIFLSDCKKL